MKVKGIFDTYAQLSESDLAFEVSGCRYKGLNSEGIHVFLVSDPEVLISMLTNCFGKYILNSNLEYCYSDGTKAKFVKSRNSFVFRCAGSKIAEVRLCSEEVNSSDACNS